MAQRNAARVLPLPVGAVASRCPPEAISRQARDWMRVGLPTRSANQRATSGWNWLRTSSICASYGQGWGGAISIIPIFLHFKLSVTMFIGDFLSLKNQIYP